MPEPSLSLIVLAWNKVHLTQRCVESLRSHTDVSHQLIIVDNGSTDGGAEFAREAADVSVLNSSNLGFAAGMNAGLAVATGRYVAFINNDTVFPAGWASQLLGVFDSSEMPGIVLPAVTASGNQISVRTEPGLQVVRMREFVDLPSGVVYLMRTEVAKALEGWDERYQVASREDLDLLFKVWCNNLAVWLDERVLVHHEYNVTAKALLPDRDEIWQRNWEVFVNRWSHADMKTVPRLPSISESAFEQNLRTASVAAHWMARWHESWSGERELSRQLREAMPQRRGRAKSISGWLRRVRGRG